MTLRNCQVTVINLQNRQILRPTLTEDSLKPLQRMRHASCVVMPNSLPQDAEASPTGPWGW